MTFEQLQLLPGLLKALQAEGYEKPTPIQEQAIPHVLAGKDLLGLAQTGTGKTAAFALPILQHLFPLAKQQRRPISALVLAPTRELAIQINDSFVAYGKFTNITTAVVFGGVNQYSQVKALRGTVDILIATPGRLLDLMAQGYVDLRHIRIFVLDEADRMLDMGFIRDIRKIIGFLPAKRQTLLFSATMPEEIASLAAENLHHPERVEIKSATATADRVEQFVYMIDKKRKQDLLVYLLKSENLDKTLVFSRTKHGADKIVKKLIRSGINSAAIHGNKSQNHRQATLNDFRKGKVKVLVATDLAARGLDVDEISHVFNYDLPEVPETYVHRIGRTARAGAEGTAISFVSDDERSLLRAIKNTARVNPVVKDLPDLPPPSAESIAEEKQRPQRQPRRESPTRSEAPGERHARRNNRGPEKRKETPKQQHSNAPAKKHKQNERPSEQKNRQSENRQENRGPRRESGQRSESRNSYGGNRNGSSREKSGQHSGTPRRERGNETRQENNTGRPQRKPAHSNAGPRTQQRPAELRRESAPAHSPAPKKEEKQEEKSGGMRKLFNLLRGKK